MTSEISLKQKLSKQLLTIGSWLTIGNSTIAEIMANCAFDWLTIDLEHSVITIDAAEQLIRTIALSNVAPLVRITSLDQALIKRVMDAGAHGIIVPQVNTQQQAQQAVEAVYYPPRGKRGVGLARAHAYGENFTGYQQWLEHEAVVIVQIEHKDALQNLTAIFDTPGVDGYIIGPYDLSASFGKPGDFTNDQYLAAIEKITQIAQNYHIAKGVHVVEPSITTVHEQIKAGYNFIGYSVDIRMLCNVCKNGLSKIRNIQ